MFYTMIMVVVTQLSTFVKTANLKLKNFIIRQLYFDKSSKKKNLNYLVLISESWEASNLIKPIHIH